MESDWCGNEEGFEGEGLIVGACEKEVGVCGRDGTG